jgi:hypothetical protein
MHGSRASDLIEPNLRSLSILLFLFRTGRTFTLNRLSLLSLWGFLSHPLFGFRRSLLFSLVKKPGRKGRRKEKEGRKGNEIVTHEFLRNRHDGRQSSLSIRQ